ncbi:hypothetical protein OGAPHI_003249 [Ogataea philodendri]|uniref:Amino acid permease/ SLC12A domain-containing protein n=1 Tax=Ogataea philodendri TaxID=1378263 RepID=A0A9P8T672_9ASCO|nr:uncharacterized protein OGAPHI_003249 [Ogataea philodendri]KAH3666800.1 hypothetical protein OGAPHI_003249 [Ogataea philodendri]
MEQPRSLSKYLIMNDLEKRPEVVQQQVQESRGGWLQRKINTFKPATKTDGAAPLKHQLGSFQMQMISLGGSIGTGLFLGSAQSLKDGGAGGVLICYSVISIMVFCMVHSLAELACNFPVPGAFSYYATTFIDPSWGFAISWNYVMQWLVLLPLELSAASITFKFWDGFPIGDGYLITAFFLMMILINMLPVKIYGFAEVVFSVTKIIAILGFLVTGLVILFGGVPNHDAILGRYWHDPGPFTPSGFKGIVAVFVTAAFSFSGTELCGLCAAETPNPVKSIPKASKQVFWRILFFYISSLTLVGFLVPYNEPRLMGRDESGANSSPFVIAIRNAGIPVLPSIMNVAILISILSVGNSAIYATSRTLVSLAQAGMAPKSFGYIDQGGRPMVAILVTLAFGCLSYLSLVGNGAQILFSWLLSLSGLSSLLTWCSIGLSLIRFRAGIAAQGQTTKDLNYVSTTGLGGAWICFGFGVVVLVAQLWIAVMPVQGTSSAEKFFKVYLGAFVVAIFFAAHKGYVYWQTGRVQFGINPAHMDVFSGRLEMEQQALAAKKWYKW